MDKRRKTVRLTLRMSDGLDKQIREEARKESISLNQFILRVLNHWRKFHRFSPHNP